MPTSALRERLSSELLSFAWDEWAQMGVFATPRRRSAWAQDPEALIVFTLEVARDDPRLFDELLDWMVVNDPLLGGWRTRAMCTVPGDEELVAAVLAWVSRHGGRGHVLSRKRPQHDRPPRPLFRGLTTSIADPDEAFAAQGLLRPVVAPSGKSQPPHLLAPINFAFRLRQILGVTARAEIARCLLTTDVQRVTSGVVARAAGYSPRNVNETLALLQGAGVVSMTGVGSEQYYSLDRRRWTAFLGMEPDELPRQRDWPQLLAALRRILRWLSEPETEALSDYLLASRARDLLEAVHIDLVYAGVPVEFGPTVEDALMGLEATVDRALEQLRAPDAPNDGGAIRVAPDRDRRLGRSPLEVYQDKAGAFRWRLKAGNGQIIAVSPDSFTAERLARDSARHFADNAPELEPDVYQDAAGAYRWRVRTANGMLIASSGDSFATRSNARRAAENASRNVRGALRT
jgi:uncharacterized protein YegP (UPF0339 family)